jgi:dolichyl-phosphate-mannose-protein mannosyltransferase
VLAGPAFPSKIPGFIKRTKLQPTGRSELIIIFGYLANVLPFMAVPRGMFLYHYLPALIFAILGIGLLLDRVDHKRMLGTILLAASIFGFLYFAPITYGIPVSKAAMSRMFWFDGWR